jgi:hypothetical protein
MGFMGGFRALFGPVRLVVAEVEDALLRCEDRVKYT